MLLNFLKRKEKIPEEKIWFERYKAQTLKLNEVRKTLEKYRDHLQEAKHTGKQLRECRIQKEDLEKAYQELRLAFELAVSQLPDVKIIAGERIIEIKGK